MLRYTECIVLIAAAYIDYAIALGTVDLEQYLALGHLAWRG